MNKIKSNKNFITIGFLLLFILNFILLVYSVAVNHTNSLESIKYFEEEILELNNQIKDYQDTLNISQKTISECKNEILQLKDRVAFLSAVHTVSTFNKSIQAVNTSADTQIEEVVDLTEQYQWNDYKNLFTIGQSVPLPINIHTNTFRCMDYKLITDKQSWQYKIQGQSKTDFTSGLRYYEYNNEKYYTVALATAYGIDLGNAYKVILNNGTIFNIIHAEYKHDIRYPSPIDYGDDDNNYDGDKTISIIEFIYDRTCAPERLINAGEANEYLGVGCSIYGYGCDIKEIVYLGKIWSTEG